MVARDFIDERPRWILSCYSHRREGTNDLTGDISVEEARWKHYSVSLGSNVGLAGHRGAGDTLVAAAVRWSSSVRGIHAASRQRLQGMHAFLDLMRGSVLPTSQERAQGKPEYQLGQEFKAALTAKDKELRAIKRVRACCKRHAVMMHVCLRQLLQTVVRERSGPAFAAKVHELSKARYGLTQQPVAAVGLQAADQRQKLPSLGGPPIHEPNPWVDEAAGKRSVVFGAAAGQPKPVFGGSFGQAAAQPQAAAGFGAPAAALAGMFGQPAAFGQQPQQQTQQQPTVFGLPAAATGFGQQTAPTVWGQAQQAQPAAGFGQPQGVGGVFGQAQPVGGAFGAGAAQPQPPQQAVFGVQPGAAAPAALSGPFGGFGAAAPSAQVGTDQQSLTAFSMHLCCFVQDGLFSHVTSCCRSCGARRLGNRPCWPAALGKVLPPWPQTLCSGSRHLRLRQGLAISVGRLPCQHHQPSLPQGPLWQD